MLNLFDYLTEEDNKNINNYIVAYGDKRYIGNEEWLKPWAESKKKLFRLLGGNLIYKMPFEIEKPKDLIEKELVDFVHEEDFFSRLRAEISRNFLIAPKATEEQKDFYLFATDALSALHFSTNVCHESHKYYKAETGKTYSFQKGEKIIKAIRKILNCLPAKDAEPLLKEYDAIRIKHSRIFNEKVIKGNLCFSIHPLDFLTMSDNNSGWSTCMTWTKINKYNHQHDPGQFREGTIEMMNSNNVVCVYLESLGRPFTFVGGEWNNKKWRQLFFCTKEIIVGGKAYPFINDKITFTALAMLRQLALKNWNRAYKYGIEEYHDMDHILSLNRMIRNKNWILVGDTTKHNIIFDTKGMYNDMFNDKYTTYWCIRNKVKKNTIISVSGKAPCICCGKSIISYDQDRADDNDYNERYFNSENVLCPACLETQTDEDKLIF